MADEAKIVTLLGNGGDPVEYTVATGTAIVKGELGELEDNSGAKKVSGAGVVLVGIATADKSTTDGITVMSYITHAVIRVKVSSGGTSVLGSYVRSASTDNTVTVATTLDNETGKGLGKSLQTGGNSEEIDVLMNL